MPRKNSFAQLKKFIDYVSPKAKEVRIQHPEFGEIYINFVEERAVTKSVKAAPAQPPSTPTEKTDSINIEKVREGMNSEEYRRILFKAADGGH